MAVTPATENEPALEKTLARMLIPSAVTSGKRAAAGGLRLPALIESDIVLICIFMQNLEGIEVLAENQWRTNAAKLIVMPGASGSGIDYLNAAAELGADLTLRKPFPLTHWRKPSMPV